MTSSSTPYHVLKQVLDQYSADLQWAMVDLEVDYHAMCMEGAANLRDAVYYLFAFVSGETESIGPALRAFTQAIYAYRGRYVELRLKEIARRQRELCDLVRQGAVLSPTERDIVRDGNTVRTIFEQDFTEKVGNDIEDDRELFRRAVTELGGVTRNLEELCLAARARINNPLAGLQGEG